MQQRLAVGANENIRVKSVLPEPAQSPRPAQDRVPSVLIFLQQGERRPISFFQQTPGMQRRPQLPFDSARPAKGHGSKSPKGQPIPGRSTKSSLLRRHSAIAFCNIPSKRPGPAPAPPAAKTVLCPPLQRELAPELGKAKRILRFFTANIPLLTVSYQTAAKSTTGAQSGNGQTAEQIPPPLSAG